MGLLNLDKIPAFKLATSKETQSRLQRIHDFIKELRGDSISRWMYSPNLMCIQKEAGIAIMKDVEVVFNDLSVEEMAQNAKSRE